MRRRRFLVTVAAVGAAPGCLRAPDWPGGRPEPGDEQTGESASPTDQPSADTTVTDGGPTSGDEFTATFDVVDKACGDAEDAADVAFESTEARVTVTGVVGAPSLCYSAGLADARRDPGDGTLNVGVGTVDECDGDQVGGQCLADVAYRAVFAFDGDLPETVTVSHDGDVVGVFERDSS